jgi:hypothetical protein
MSDTLYHVVHAPQILVGLCIRDMSFLDWCRFAILTSVFAVWSGVVTAVERV